MIAFFSNLYKTDPIKFFMMIAIIYLLLKQSNVIESFKPSNVDGTIDVTAISNVSQLAQKINKALDIDTAGNVNFKNKVTLGGNKITLEQTGKISNIGGFKVTNTGAVTTGHLTAVGGGNITATGKFKGNRSIVKGHHLGWWDVGSQKPKPFSETKNFDRIYVIRCRPGDAQGHRGVRILIDNVAVGMMANRNPNFGRNEDWLSSSYFVPAGSNFKYDWAVNSAHAWYGRPPAEMYYLRYDFK